MPVPMTIDFDQKELRERYLAKRESRASLNNQLDSPTLLSMLGTVQSRSIIEIGCGGGSLAAILLGRGVISYVGIDRSNEMISLAKQRLTNSGFDFRTIDIERDEIPGSGFDIAISALTFHFLRDWESVLRKVSAALVSGGQFVFSVRHPIRTCNPTGLHKDKEGWDVRTYFSEGPREIIWHDHPVVVYHRTLSSMISAIVGAGFAIRAVAEIAPEADKVLDDDRDHLFVPGFVHFHCIKLAIAFR
jgi:SAM-dependent methyltransferase